MNPPCHRWIVALLVVICFAAGRADAVDHVIQISVDGLSAQLLTGYLAASPADFPNFKRFVDQGATTLNARCDFTHSVTMPNHTCMLTGRPVLPPAGKPDSIAHGYTANGEPDAPEILHRKSDGSDLYIATTLDVVHDHGMTTGFYASKGKFNVFTKSCDTSHGAADTVGPDNGRNKTDFVCITDQESTLIADSADMQKQLLRDLALHHMAYTFVHYREPDTAGHAKKWGSATYREAVVHVDAYLGQLFSLVESDPQLKGKTIIILTADHGGPPGKGSHTDATNPACYTIPFFVWGEGVPHADLYTLNSATRADPAAGRPDYNVTKQPIRNGDTGNLALKLLGLPAIPGSSINSAQDLAVK